MSEKKILAIDFFEAGKASSQKEILTEKFVDIIGEHVSLFGKLNLGSASLNDRADMMEIMMAGQLNIFYTILQDYLDITNPRYRIQIIHEILEQITSRLAEIKDDV